MTGPRIDPATRRKLRQETGGSRTQRRGGTKSHGKPKPRQLLAEKIEQWKRQQKGDRAP